MSLAGRICAALLQIAVVAMAASAVAAADAPKHPQRIVSTNLCTDQILLRLVEADRIVSLTHLSWRPEWTAPELAPLLSRFRPNHGLAEEVLMMNPDLVLGTTFSARFSNDLLKRLGKDVVLFAPENSFDDWYANIRKLGDAVGEPARAEAMIVEFQRGLAGLRAEIPPGQPPIYAALQANNWMPGKDTLFTEIVNAGGFRTAGETLGFSGYRTIPLEELIRIDAALVSTGLDSRAPSSLARDSLKHPLLRMMADRALARVEIPSRFTICPTPETLNMIRELVEARKRVDRLRAERGLASSGQVSR